ncbi:hypothetical protein COLO4_36412 [Corchorus olitorius]|uniref:Uncharacterized protein n=1 Tax=Corchorus olitorius TaxID=93759 RepID=A0A1R3G8Z9_9ROSI|nr:hypothetical protein COLO4_36412 [Corchorus olitorius]
MTHPFFKGYFPSFPLTCDTNGVIPKIPLSVSGCHQMGMDEVMS